MTKKKWNIVFILFVSGLLTVGIVMLVYCGIKTKQLVEPVLTDIFGTAGFEELKDDREKFAVMISENNVDVKKDGEIELPLEFKHISAAGKCFLVERYDGVYVYYIAVNGIAGESRGFIYRLDGLSNDLKEKADPTCWRFVRCEDIDGKWKSVTTDG